MRSCLLHLRMFICPHSLIRKEKNDNSVVVVVVVVYPSTPPVLGLISGPCQIHKRQTETDVVTRGESPAWLGFRSTGSPRQLKPI